MNESFQVFELEAYQSRYEQTVEINLADSGVECASIGELLDPDQIASLQNFQLHYPEVNGLESLRRKIADLYDGALPSNVFVTVGASEANSLVASTLLRRGDKVVVLSPGYRQVWGLAQNIGCHVKELVLERHETGWELTRDQVEAAITPGTRLVSITNPNNPTGTVMGPEIMEVIVGAARRAGAWLHADEVYHGTELNQTAAARSFWGASRQTVCVNSLSKAYGLAGLRIGWIVAHEEFVDACWRRHEYAVIAAAGPSMALADTALEPETRARLLNRQQAITRRGHSLLDEWAKSLDGLVWAPPPTATSLAFPRYNLPLSSSAVADVIRIRGDVLVAPGVTLGADRHLRIAIGCDADKISRGLSRIGTVLRELALQHA